MSWIQDKRKQIRNTWNSRGDSVNDISLVTPNSPRSPRSPPLPSSPEQTIDIVLSLPKRYPNHRKARNLLNSLNSLSSSDTNRQSYGRDSLSEDTTRNSVSPLSDLQVSLPPSGGSGAPGSPSHSSLIQLRRPLPHTSNTCVLSVSHDVGREDLVHPEDMVMHVRLPKRRDRRHGSILRNLIESKLATVYRKDNTAESEGRTTQEDGEATQGVAQEIQEVSGTQQTQESHEVSVVEERKEESRTVEDLIKMVDGISRPEPHSTVSFDDIDFSQPSTPMQPDTEEEDEDLVGVFNELMREECPLPIDGEEMERGTGEEERLIWDENEEMEKKQEDMKKQEEERKKQEEARKQEEMKQQEEERRREEEKKRQDEELAKVASETEEKQQEEAKQREKKVAEDEAQRLEEIKQKEEMKRLSEVEAKRKETLNEPRVTEMPIETMLQTMGYKSLAFSSHESPLEIEESGIPEVQEETFSVPTPEVEVKELEPTEEQKERVKNWEIQFQLRMEVKEKEERELKEQLLQQAKAQLETLHEEISQLCELHRHERCEAFQPTIPRWREIEFRNVLGECAPLLFPLIGVMDMLVGAVL